MQRRTFLAGTLAAPIAAWATAGSAQAAVALRQRPAGATVTPIDGRWNEPFPGSLGGKYLLFRNSEYIVLRGQGYFLVRWEIEYWVGYGQVVMPTWSNRSGTFLHVASGGGHRMDDLSPDPNAEPRQTWMGRPSIGYTTLPPNTPMIWVNEWYYLDGTITLTCNEGAAKYNLGVTDHTWQTVYNDINHAPQAGTSWIRYGLSYDK